MPEPLSISMAALGIIGALNTAVNSVESVYSNVKTWKKARLAIEDLKEKVNENNQSLVAWQEEWMAWEDDEPFCQFLWGEDWTSLREALNAILIYSKDLKNSLDALLKSSSSLSMKTKYVFVKKNHLKECTGALTDKVSRLHTKSWQCFCTEYRRQRDRYDTPSRTDVQILGNLFQMVRLCLKTRDLSQTFHGACLRDRSDMVVDLELDFFGADVADDRSKAISKAAAKNTLHFKVFAKEREDYDTMVKTVVYQDSSLSEVDCRRTFSRALQHVFSERTASAFDDDGGFRYRVEEVLSVRTIDSQCYRRQILSLDSTRLPDVAGHPPSPQKIKLALDLVEAGLLFLKTSWFAGLCSCSVRHWQAERPPGNAPLLRTGSVHHVQPHRANVRPNHCWCDPLVVLTPGNAVMSGMSDEHVRLLGIVLTEIMTGCPVLNVRRDPNAAAGIELDVVTGTPPVRHVETLQDTLSRIREATSERCSEAVGFCLRSNKTPTQVEKTDVEEYYWEVLLPIEEYYQTLTRRRPLPPSP
ncbi:MAG: hypothetical protein HETSPECPRED_005872 [Heterodermia speciosa]|uniref:Uncharacterized protein n=1 Tax=Heterodermia speciosa TaxID=116794 RepID=A0A8H3ILS7_9LECA|nr:MAG: hypothetical protein HETSPECPRED_005872 [Heterodermia speciosa]